MNFSKTIGLTLLGCMSCSASFALGAKKVTDEAGAFFYIIECEGNAYEILWTDPVSINESAGNDYAKEVKFNIERFGKQSVKDVSSKRDQLVELAKKHGYNLCGYKK
ncbi:hypothetical protein [Planctobacterium marinum]|uniref:Uncharacterized protein n=1 Tax=Planctobacterium marinum TaxID=1631968 RepID=A0AA48HJJ9_9ALTE|nr:hypothetical protein MACH26_14270 [Planctobacterium marinum]